MTENQREFFESMFAGINQDDGHSLTAENRKAVTIWLPIDYQKKFEQVQSQTKKRFGKKLREFIMQALDQVAG